MIYLLFTTYGLFCNTRSIIPGDIDLINYVTVPAYFSYAEKIKGDSIGESRISFSGGAKLDIGVNNRFRIGLKGQLSQNSSAGFYVGTRFIPMLYAETEIHLTFPDILVSPEISLSFIKDVTETSAFYSGLKIFYHPRMIFDSYYRNESKPFTDITLYAGFHVYKEEKGSIESQLFLPTGLLIEVGIPLNHETKKVIFGFSLEGLFFLGVGTLGAFGAGAAGCLY